MIEGSCCCGEVRFAVTERPKMLVQCHCSRCRKVGATPFVLIERAVFELVSGREQITEYRADSPFKFVRAFCAKCGTSLGEMTSDEQSFPIPASCFDEDLGLTVRFHEHVATKPSWVEIPPGEKQFDGDPF